MSKFWSKVIRGLAPYVPGEQPKDRKYVKLNTNENPYPPSPAVLEVIREHTGQDLRLYPDPNGDILKTAVASCYQVDKNNVFVGNGSDEVLAFTFIAFFKQEKPILYPDITYSFYPVYSKLFEIEALTIPLTTDFQINLDDYPAENGGVIFPNPNAPTGRLLNLEQIESLLKRNTASVVVVDEAYVDFGGVSCIPLVENYPNLLVCQTLSKARSLAGMRIGYAIGAPELIDGLERAKNCFNSYTLSRLAQVAGTAAMNDRLYFETTCQAIIATREWVVRELEQLDFEVVPSAANFVFIRHYNRKAGELFCELRQRGVLVRYFNLPRIDNHLRVTIGTDDEMKELIKQLKAILSGG
ncbi:MAG: Histidinol-phosphate aminotransferase [Pelotomaculum sp. PtaB.Bin104]|nr:MAG: Histidinol-phosphate aminotransferase [Pelotomaculum sp. PtaB.Bin104]